MTFVVEVFSRLLFIKNITISEWARYAATQCYHVMQVKIKQETQRSPATLEIALRQQRGVADNAQYAGMEHIYSKIAYEGDEDKQNTSCEMMDNIRNIVLKQNERLNFAKRMIKRTTTLSQRHITLIRTSLL